MKINSARQEQGIPGVYGLLLLDVVSRWGYNDQTLFAPFHLTSEQLADLNIGFLFMLPMNWLNMLCV
jgi:hypothetical protein